MVDPAVNFLELGRNELRVGVVLPGRSPGGKLPVIMAPYGGPGAQMVMAVALLWLEAQWVADQGFAVVVADGRGTPGRGPEFERQVYRDLAMRRARGPGRKPSTVRRRRSPSWTYPGWG